MQQRPLLGRAPACALVVALLAVHSPSPAADMLRGGDMAGAVEPGDYRVAQTITVRQGATLTIKAGTRIRFAPFTGIVVNGTLICDGTARDPVVLTAQKEGTGTEEPAAFDWNGVKVASSASNVRLSHTRIRYSTFGLSVETNWIPVKLEQVTFRNNGYASLSRAGNPKAVWEGTPMDLQWPEAAGTKEAAAEATRSTKRSGYARWKPPAFALSGCVLAGGGAMWIVGHALAERYNERYQDRSLSPERVSFYKNKRNDAVGLRDAGMILTLLGGAGLGVTLFF